MEGYSNHGGYYISSPFATFDATSFRLHLQLSEKPEAQRGTTDRSGMNRRVFVPAIPRVIEKLQSRVTHTRGAKLVVDRPNPLS